MSDRQLFGIGSGRTARSVATTGASIGASIGSRFGPVGAGVASGFGGAVGYLIGSSLDGVTPIPDGGRPIDAADRSGRVTRAGGPERVERAQKIGSAQETEPRIRPESAHTHSDDAGPGDDEAGSAGVNASSAELSRRGTTEPVFIDVVEE